MRWEGPCRVYYLSKMSSSCSDLEESKESCALKGKRNPFACDAVPFSVCLSPGPCFIFMGIKGRLY